MKYDYFKIKEMEEMNLYFLNCSQIQTYNPIFKKIFQLNETNSNNVILKSKYTIKKFISKNSYNFLQAVLDNGNETKQTDIFIKFASLFDPVKYGMNKINEIKDSYNILPKFIDNNAHTYVKDYNNTSYIDGLFTYVTSVLLNNFDFSNLPLTTQFRATPPARHKFSI